MAPSLVFSVSELTRHIRETIEPVYRDTWVEGEISNLRVPASGHCYLTLKDAGSQLRAVLFRAQRQRLRFTPENGLQVLCRGRITVYEPRGDYQLQIERMEPAGQGDLQLAFEQLKQRLAAEGLFEQHRKKPLPFLPAAIAVVTSPTGAAVRDILNVLGRRMPAVPVTVVPCLVQGGTAPGDICRALDAAQRIGADLVILARGGGSLEDLWAFNTEEVARAISSARVAIISGVGHETDTTIADYVADMRAPTPSAAAELAVPHHAMLSERLAQARTRLETGLHRCCARARDRTTRCQQLLIRPQRGLRTHAQRNDELAQRLTAALPRALERHRRTAVQQRALLLACAPGHTVPRQRESLALRRRALTQAVGTALHTQRNRLQQLAASLEALSPLNILGRGYSICCRLPECTPVIDAAALRTGDQVHVRFHRGHARCIVQSINE